MICVKNIHPLQCCCGEAFADLHSLFIHLASPAHAKDSLKEVCTNCKLKKNTQLATLSIMPCKSPAQSDCKRVDLEKWCYKCLCQQPGLQPGLTFEIAEVPGLFSTKGDADSSYFYIDETHTLVQWSLVHENMFSQTEDVNHTTKEVLHAVGRIRDSTLIQTVENLWQCRGSALCEVTMLHDMSKQKAIETLKNCYAGTVIRKLDDSTLSEWFLNYFFPITQNEESLPAPVSAEENKVLHAVQTIGQLSTKTANRVYHSVAAQLKTIKKEDVANYMSSVVSILHLTNFINLGQASGSGTSSSTSDKSSHTSEKKDEPKME